MPYTIEQPENLPAPALLVTLLDPFDGSAEAAQMVNDLNSAVARITGDPTYMIADLTQIKLDLGTIMHGLAAAFAPHQDISTENLDAGRVRTLMVGTGTLMKLAVNATGQDQYGNRQITLFETLDEALAHIKQAHDGANN